MRIRDNDYDLTPEIFKALSYTGFTGKTMKNEIDTLMLNKITNDLVYTGVGNRPSNRKKFSTITLSKIVDEIKNKTFDKIDLEGQGVKIIIPSNIIDIYTRFEVLLGLKLSGHTDTLTEASNLFDELYKRSEIQNEQQHRNAFDKFRTQKRELPSKIIEQIAFKTRPKIEKHMFIVMDKSKHEERLSQPVETNNKQFKIAVTFLTGYNGIFIVNNSNNKFYFTKCITDEDFIQVVIPHGAYEIESLNNGIKRTNIAKCPYSENENPFTKKPKFITSGSFIEILPQGPIIGFVFNFNIGNLLGFHETILWQEYNLSPNLVDNLSIDIIFLESDIAEGMPFKGRRSDIIHNFTMVVDPG